MAEAATLSSSVSTAVQGVDAATLAGSSAGHSFSIIGMFLQADIVVKVVMVLLLLASFWCWAIIFEKYFLFRNVKTKALRFEVARAGRLDLQADPVPGIAPEDALLFIVVEHRVSKYLIRHSAHSERWPLQRQFRGGTRHGYLPSCDRI